MAENKNTKNKTVKKNKTKYSFKIGDYVLYKVNSNTSPLKGKKGFILRVNNVTKLSCHVDFSKDKGPADQYVPFRFLEKISNTSNNNNVQQASSSGVVVAEDNKKTNKNDATSPEQLSPNKSLTERSTPVTSTPVQQQGKQSTTKKKIASPPTDSPFDPAEPDPSVLKLDPFEKKLSTIIDSQTAEENNEKWKIKAEETLYDARVKDISENIKKKAFTWEFAKKVITERLNFYNSQENESKKNAFFVVVYKEMLEDIPKHGSEDTSAEIETGNDPETTQTKNDGTNPPSGNVPGTTESKHDDTTTSPPGNDEKKKTETKHDNTTSTGNTQTDASTGTEDLDEKIESSPNKPQVGEAKNRRQTTTTVSTHTQTYNHERPLTQMTVEDLHNHNGDTLLLPDTLRRNMTMYDSEIQSGFANPFVNPFAVFQYRNAGDSYNYLPLQSVNHMRRKRNMHKIGRIAAQEAFAASDARRDLKKQRLMTHPPGLEKEPVLKTKIVLNPAAGNYSLSGTVQAMHPKINFLPRNMGALTGKAKQIFGQDKSANIRERNYLRYPVDVYNTTRAFV